MQERQRSRATKERNDPLGGERPRAPAGRYPWSNEEWINERAQIQQDGIENDHRHALQRIAVYDVRADDGIPHLQTGGEEEERHLPDHPVVGFVDRDAPDDESD